MGGGTDDDGDAPTGKGRDGCGGGWDRGSSSEDGCIFLEVVL